MRPHSPSRLASEPTPGVFGLGVGDGGFASANDGAHAAGQWQPRGPYALRHSLGILSRGSDDPYTRVGERDAWIAFRTETGPVTLRVTVRTAPLRSAARGEDTARNDDDGGWPHAVVHWRAWGEGAAALASDPRRVDRLLGAEDDWSGFDAPQFAATLPPALRRMRHEHPGLRLPATGRVFDALVPTVLEQKVTTLEARHAWRYLGARFADPAPRPSGAGRAACPTGLRLPLTPAQLKSIPSWEWHAARVDSKRRRTLLQAAEAATGVNRLGARSIAAEAELEAVSSALQSLPGIGPWSTAETLQRSHGAADSVAVGDFHLAAEIGAAFTGRRTDDPGMLRLLEPWRGHRQRVVRLIQLTGFRKQAFGPRLAPEDHRRR